MNTIKVRIDGPVATLQLDRPKALNALNREMMNEVVETLANFEHDDSVRVIVLTGSDKAFAAGADITEMTDKQAHEAILEDFLGDWNAIARCQKPIIAAVAGYALGGGCEIAMACDFIIAADNARFGQPEIRIGTIPGLGGTQRLTRLVGKAKAMDMCLTGRQMDAEEAERAGLVSRVVPLEAFETEVQSVAQEIARLPRKAVLLARDAVDAALNAPLEQGLDYERKLFLSLFGDADQQEGMSAFVEKREPSFR